MSRLALALALGLAAAAAPVDAAEIRGVAEVVDGDTLKLDGLVPVRLWGIDAPEAREPGGAAATSALVRLAGGRALRCEVVDVDRYRRIVAECFVGEAPGESINLAAALVREGMALDWPRYSGGHYAPEQAAARAARAGLWSGPFKGR